MARAVLLVVVCLFLQPAAVMAVERTNVILFLVDDLGWMDLGCQGSTYYRTPNIDRLAARGIRFTDAYAACAVCTPTRASIMTGKYPARNMMTQWLPAGRWSASGHRMREGRFLRGLPLEEVTLAEALREAGYRTLHVGKWHLGGPPFSLPAQHGFEVNVGGSEHGAPGSYFYPYKGSWKIPTTEERVQKITLPDGREGEYLTDRLTDEALALIEKSKEKPFFLYLALPAPHTPILPTKAFAGKSGTNAYGDFVLQVDDTVGRVMKAVDEAGIADDTLFIFTTDNGCSPRADFAALKKFGHHPSDVYRGHKADIYEGGHRVPFIARWPKQVAAGARSDEVICLTDLMRTCADVIGKPLPETAGEDSVSILPALVGARLRGPLREATVHHSIN
ncbi:MAG: sulfatase, partial [Roseibacillus sp.]|nr:sulfatase [Roseibacillus sp.]